MSDHLSPIYWVHGGDEGLDYCQDCIDAAVEEERQDHPDRADWIIRDGGYDRHHECDSPSTCENCGAMLACSLPDGTCIDTAKEWVRAFSAAMGEG